MSPIAELLKKLWCVISEEDNGFVVLCSGHHEIKIKTCCKPCEVYLSVCESDCMPVCVGDVTLVGSQILDDGFILYADVKTSACLVKWVAEY